MYVAHKSGDGRFQSVEDHCGAVACMAAEFARPFGMAEVARQAGRFHDVGKTSDGFQDRVLNNGPKVDHSTAGGWECWKAGDRISAIVDACHHSGLLDFGGSGYGGSTVWNRMKKANDGCIPAYKPLYEPVGPVVQVPMNSRYGVSPEVFSMACRIRGVFSSVVDADFLDTEKFMRGARKSGGKVSVDLLVKLKDYAKEKGWDDPKTDLDRLRTDVFYRAMEKGWKSKPGLFSETDPTGSGKTTASLAFALTHALEYHKDRIIYVIPYTSIIEQNSEKFREILGADVVLEHHSNYMGLADPEDEAELGYTLRLASENWDMPVVVTTSVRFFEAFYGSRTSECRRLHNIANSVVIFDEAQMLPVPLLKPCTRAIEELVKNFNVTAVLSTATCPSLDRFFSMPVTEIEDKKDLLAKSLRRNRILVERDKKSCADIAEIMSEQKQVLCIVNTRAAAQEVYGLLPVEGRYCLTTLTYPKQRRAMLKQIKEDLAAGKTVRVVATSLIEAGVDVDFSFVMREAAGLDSILQAAGRCNREGRRHPDECIVLVFVRDGYVPSALEQHISAFWTVYGRYSDIASLEAIKAYFDELYRLTGEKNMDRGGIVEMFETGKPYGPYPFRTASEKFRFIESGARTVYILDEENEALIAELRSGKAGMDTYRALGQYGVSVYPRKFDELVRYGHVEAMPDGSGVLADRNLYSDETGLDCEPASGNGIFV